MANANNNKEILYQNLSDAGCSEELKNECMMLAECSDTAELIRLLREYKKAMLASVHMEEKRIDCLDYLMYRLKKENKQEEQKNGREIKFGS